ncbi:MAG: hypothetical protein HC904_13985 [Blastochloris sp.]|nr:hypothetical protein [Blastochloris sp.]
MIKKVTQFTLLLTLALSLSSCGETQKLPPDSAYVVVDKNGHLTINGKRERYWAIIGKPYIHFPAKEGETEEERKERVAKSRKATDALLDRFEALGFNAVRMWDAVPNTESYEVGDGSRADSVDYMLKRAKEKGFRIWLAGFNRSGHATAADVDIIQDPATAEQWKEAFVQGDAGMVKKDGTPMAGASAGKINIRESIARIWDPRLEALYVERIKAIAQHTNKHTGLRWSDDPVFAVWELANEEWWMRKMVGGRWQREPAYFRNQLVAKWNDWLKKKYGSDEKLGQAWEQLLPGESLDKGSILLAPMAGKVSSATSMNDSNEKARASLEGLAQEYRLEDFARARASDVIEFSWKSSLPTRTGSWPR